MMTRANIALRLEAAVKNAPDARPALAGRRVSPHGTRPTAVMRLLQVGVDISMIALWLRHESPVPVTAHRNVEADLAMKEQAVARLHGPEAKIQHYRTPESLLNFLKTL